MPTLPDQTKKSRAFIEEVRSSVKKTNEKRREATDHTFCEKSQKS